MEGSIQDSKRVLESPFHHVYQVDKIVSKIVLTESPKKVFVWSPNEVHVHLFKRGNKLI